MRNLISTLAGFALGATSALTTAFAADLPSKAVAPVFVEPEPAFHHFYARVGVSGVIFDSHANVSIPALAALGAPTFFGESAKVGNTVSTYLEAGYYIIPSVSVAISGGIPPTLALTGQNGLAANGVLARSISGLPTFTAAYHFTMFGPFRPYIGGGLAYAITFRNETAAVLNPYLKSAPAAVVVGGVDYDLDEHWSLFVDVKKAFLTQSLSGTAQVPAPVPGGVFLTPSSGTVRTDPLLVSGGIGYRFW